ncbi:MAG: hypothetical protein JWO19_149 [Bryobacterales bacterium]|jgi:hypothetical protein|nr:hypothetical protein [Bryobacterales bacterium]
MRAYVDAIDAFSKAGEVLARYSPVRRDGEFNSAWADCENTRQTLQFARKEVLSHIARHHGSDETVLKMEDAAKKSSDD